MYIKRLNLVGTLPQVAVFILYACELNLSLPLSLYRSLSPFLYLRNPLIVAEGWGGGLNATCESVQLSGTIRLHHSLIAVFIHPSI